MNQGWGCAIGLASIFVSFVGAALAVGIFLGIAAKAYQWVIV